MDLRISITLAVLLLARNAEAVPILAPPAYTLHRKNPTYPVDALQQGLEGYVVFQLRIAPDGHVGSIQVMESEPQGVFEKAALAAIREWRYIPKDGDRFTRSFTIPSMVRFRLEGGPGGTEMTASSRQLQQPHPKMIIKKTAVGWRLEAAESLTAKPKAEVP